MLRLGRFDLSPLRSTRQAHGSLAVARDEGPHTADLARFGSLASRQLGFGLPWAAGSRYLNRTLTSEPVAGWGPFTQSPFEILIAPSIEYCPTVNSLKSGGGGGGATNLL